MMRGYTNYSVSGVLQELTVKSRKYHDLYYNVLELENTNSRKLRSKSSTTRTHE